jgi:ribosome biogenesis GTPase / thiamine phosphate phosphatase
VEHSYLDSWGYNPWFANALACLSRPDLAPARVVSDFGARLEIVEATRTITAAQPSGRLRRERHPGSRPTVGDWLAIAAPDRPDGFAVIHGVLPRRSQLVRRAAGRRDDAQIVAANVDTFLIVTSANRDANPRRLERYLTAVWDSGAAPVIVVNKRDLCGPGALDAALAELAAVAPGVPIAAVSAVSGAGLDALAPHVGPGRTIALIGSSGVGKSSLVNRLLGRDEQDVRPIDAEDRGRHATTRRQLFALPSGGLVIDTPGMRELGLVDDAGGLDDAFAEVSELAARCRFRDCRHRGEPGCAVDAAIAAGALDPARRDAQHKLARELAALERRRDPALAREQRARWKAVHKDQRARARVDPKRRP